MTSSFLEKENLILSPSHEGSAPQKMIVSWHDFEQAVVALALNIYNSGLQFDHIVCIARGGMFLGDILSRLFQVPLAVISASSYREEGGTVQGNLAISDSIAMATNQLGSRVLLVDDLVDSGATLKAIQANLFSKYHVKMVSTAVLWKKSGTLVEPDYFVEEINANTWIVLPTEKFDGIQLSEL